MATEWNGEGIPPVGTECEATWGGKALWRKSVMLPESTAAVRLTDGWEAISIKNYKGSRAFEFRPLQSEEQKQVAGIVAILKEIGLVSDEITAKAIYNAGFRKVVE
jgi:hypothetical protein